MDTRKNEVDKGECKNTSERKGNLAGEMGKTNILEGRIHVRKRRKKSQDVLTME